MPQVNQINANSRQQFIIEEEGAYSQRSSDDDQQNNDASSKPKSKQGGGMPLQQVNNFNMNSQLNLTKKSSHSNQGGVAMAPHHHVKQNTFSYGHQGSQHSQNINDPINKTNSRNGPRGESYNENGAPGGSSQFHGDTGHDYNIQQQQQDMQAGEYPRRQIAAMTNANNMTKITITLS